MNYPSETIKQITEFLFACNDETQIPISDLVVVLGNDFIEGTVKEIDRLYRNGKINTNGKVIFSGATGSLNAGKESEAIRMYHCAVNQFHLPKELFLIEDKATNAYQNLEFSRPIIESLGGFSAFSNILLIGKSFLARRALMGAKTLEYPMDKIYYFGTVDREGRNIGADCWWEKKESADRVMQELERVGKYTVSGYLSIF